MKYDSLELLVAHPERGIAGWGDEGGAMRVLRDQVREIARSMAAPRPVSGTGFSGFTLVELMVCLGLAALLLSVAVPAVGNRLPDFRLRRAARDLCANLRSAKMGAVRANAPWAVVFDPASASYSVCSDKGEDGRWATLSDNTLVTRVYLSAYGSGVRYGWGAAGRPVSGTFDADGITYQIPFVNVVQFNPRGSCGSGYVYLQNSEGNAFGIGTRWTGAVVIRKWHPASGDWK